MKSITESLEFCLSLCFCDFPLEFLWDWGNAALAYSTEYNTMYFSIVRREPLLLNLRRETPACQTLDPTREKENDGGITTRRRRALKMVDRELSKGNFKSALSLVKKLQGTPGPAGLRGFGAANQVSQRISSLDELNLSVPEILSLQSLLDTVLDSVKTSLQFALLEEVSVLELESSINDESYNYHFEDHLMCMQHEAGHFLVGYLLGVFPKKYRVASMEAVKQERFTGGNVQFLGFEFLKEIDTVKQSKNNLNDGKLCHVSNKRKMSSQALKKFLCVILGGLVAEHLVFGHSKGLHSDVKKLDRVLKRLGFTEDEANAQIKWAALNTILILRRHGEARSMLAEAMALGRPVGFCIDIIENTLNAKEI